MRSFEHHVSNNSDYYIYTPSSAAKKLFFYPVCIGHFIYEPGYCLKRSSYDSFLIMLILKGSCMVRLDNKSLIATEGTVIFLDCYVPHQYESCTDWESIWLHFDGPLCRDYYEEITRSHGNILAPDNIRSVEHALRRICAAFQTNTAVSEAAISRYIVDILTELFLSSPDGNPFHRTRLSLADTVCYINRHFTEPVTLEALAAYASLSPFYFTRIFTKETGMTPHQYIIATRINLAKFLLKTTDIQIKEVGYASGFSSESSFCTTFKKWERITPSEYRSIVST